ncbi:peptidylprolyl isomerase [Candidatus Finniella inopinata]|uniref:Parvulin-like PPIase n=1 Tax=Candidatus Finniella inopinata TaxID=1696036 RepID=A0A4Q7DJ68_9PROT|nr:peptidylprolyl isomerase [Candidatus Finniella inopinata]RZI46185.1 hypothetical protein EQU50_04415 [Candidatus Finniella inopinata]
MKSKMTLGVVVLVAALVGWFFFFKQPKPTTETPTPAPVPEKQEAPKKEQVPPAPVTTEAPKPEVVSTPEAAPAPKEDESTDPDAKKIVAEFSSGEKITLKDVKKVFSSLPTQLQETGLEKIYEPLLNRLVDTRILLDAARKAGIDKNLEVLKRIAEAQEALIQKSYLDKEIEKLVTDAVLQEKYQELLKMIPKDQMEIKLSHILIKTKEEAADILKQLKAGTKFETLLEKSLDTESKEKGGDLGYVRKEELPKDFAELAFKAEKGSVVTEAMKIGEVGYSVIRVDDKRPVTPPEFKKVRDEIFKAVSPEYAVKVIEKLRADSGVKKTGLDGKPLVEKTPEQRKAEAEAEAKGEKTSDQPSVDLKTLEDNMVVAEFKDGEKVKIADLKESMISLPPQLKEVPFDKVFEPLLNRVIDMKLISAEARKAGMDKDPAVLKKIADAKEALTQKFYLEQEVAKLITPDMINAKYQQLLKMMPKNEMEIRLRHILVKSKEDALKVMKALKSGASFEEMVKTYSVDDQSKANNGDLGYVRRNDLPKEFADKVFKAAKATLLPEAIQVGDVGYSIVRVEDKRAIEPPKLEEARAELTKVISAELSVKVLADLRKQVTVKKFDLNGQPLVEKAAAAAPTAPAAAPSAQPAPATTEPKAPTAAPAA